MVYFGPSRGCETCKRRRKKCDEARPSCQRCTKANRTCGGYEDNDKHVFRRFGQGNGVLVPLDSMARKCSLPPRLPVPGTNVMAADADPPEVTEVQIEDFALRAFFYDYPVLSSNRALSRGYLDGLEAMVQRMGLQSDLARACKVVAFAAHGIKLCRTRLMERAEAMYSGLLGSLARSIECAKGEKSSELLMIAVLLGLYETITAGDEIQSRPNPHARGVAAILRIEDSPPDLFGAVHFIQSGHPIISNGGLKNCGIFSPAPNARSGAPNLDELLLMFGPIWRTANDMLSNPLVATEILSLLKQDAITLDQAFAAWQASQAAEINPRAIGQVAPETPGTPPKPGYWPTRFDAYFDLYVAGVWNISRTARLLLLSLVLKLSKLLNDDLNTSRHQQDALIVLDDILASIPYHLAEDLDGIVRCGSKDKSFEPGRPVGGLLLMHPIYIASTLSIVPPDVREYLKDCLSWIGKHMGICQASLFAKTPKLDDQYFADGCMIIWAGTLV